MVVHVGRVRVRIGSVWIDSLGLPEAVAAVERLCSRGRGGMVFTPNVDHIVLAEGNPPMREAYEAADLALADGQWVVWASRLLGTPLAGKASGSDFALPLARMAAARNLSMYLLGGSPGVAEEAAKRLTAETSVRICGIDASPVSLSAPDDAVVDRIARARPDLVLVALGAPKQEIWSHRNLERLRPAVLLGVGGTLDFLAGRVRRAPAWMSRSGVEWLFRLALEPRRLARRYLVNDPRFLGILARTLRQPRARRVQNPLEL
jgi:N-acetylglucosaminyldiphosphoundecaprenol N-acetyl-beta-D-mannosaminyltransferase